jgi:hypothetical protein
LEKIQANLLRKDQLFNSLTVNKKKQEIGANPFTSLDIGNIREAPKTKKEKDLVLDS